MNSKNPAIWAGRKARHARSIKWGNQPARDAAGHLPGPGLAAMSLRQAINDKCRDCIYDPMVSHNWRKQVHLCEIDTCPLWPVRPRSRANFDSAPLSDPESALSETKQAPAVL